MPLSQRRRPSPLQLVPRQTATPTGEDGGLESPDSPDFGPDSPDSPDTPTNGQAAAEDDIPSDDEGEEEESEINSSAAVPIASSVPGKAPTVTPAIPTNASQTTSLVSAVPQISGLPSATSDGGATSISTHTNSKISPLPTSANQDIAVGAPISSSASVPTSSAQPGVPAADSGGANNVVDPSQKSQQQNAGDSPPMSKGAEAALITFTILGGIALIVGIIFFMRKHRRAKELNSMRQAENAFDPGNPRSLAIPETAQTSHMTRSTTTTSLFAAADYERPETVSTDPSRSRIPPPMPTPNPFADPPLNKAYDVLRGRVRSTTLTDRGSWVGNPFKDPVSDRFDPFGELQEKAREERARYMQELQKEQELLEKERMGLRLANANARKGSGVTVEGVGVLDRSGDNRGYPR